MKKILLPALIVIIAISCTTDDDLPPLKVNNDPTISLYALINSGDPLTNSKYDISTVRIGELIKFQITATANQNSMAPISKIIISKTTGNEEKILLDTMLQDAECILRKEFYVSEKPTTETWSFTIQDKAGYSSQLKQNVQIIDPGLFGRWVALGNRGDLDPLFIENGTTVIQTRFTDEKEYFIEYFGNSNSYSEGIYTQSWNEDRQYWEFTLDQSAPLYAEFKGICKILTPSPDQIYFYYVQTEPDVGLDIPTSFKPFDELVEGEHIFTATQITFEN